MIELRRLVMREIRLPLKEPFRISSGETHTRRVLLVEAHDREGLTGWAECVAGETPHYAPETVDTAWLAIGSWIGPLVLGRAFPQPRDVFHALCGAIRGHHMARAAVEMAVWDLVAHRRGVALATLLGGTRDRVETGISIGIQASPTALADKARGAWQEGYRRVKLKIAPGRDRAWIGAVREALGEAPLCADANASYTPSDTAHLQALDAFRLTMLEQPLAAGDLVRHAELQRALATPICLDESITEVDRAVDMTTLGSGRIINIKPGRVGGHTAAIAIHDVARRHGLPVWCGGMLETGIGRAHNVALASLPGFSLPGDLSPSARYWERDIVTPEWTMQDGTLAVPYERPGLGVTIDRDRIDDLLERQHAVEGTA